MFDSFYIRTNKIVCVIETVTILHGVRGGMSSLQLSPPEAFDFKCPDNWLKWRCRFQQYYDASGLSAESDARQVNTLLYCLGEEADDVLASTHISEADRKVFSKVMEKLDGYFKVRHNVVFEQARLNQRNQLPGESAEKYIAEIYSLAENCKDAGAPQRMETCSLCL